MSGLASRLSIAGRLVGRSLVGWSVVSRWVSLGFVGYVCFLDLSVGGGDTRRACFLARASLSDPGILRIHSIRPGMT